MNSINVSYLHYQRSNVLNNINNSRHQINQLEDKILRLQEAVSSLQSSISQLESTKSTLSGNTIDENLWQGQKEKKFNNKFDSYRESVRKYIQKLKDIKEQLENEISRAEQEKVIYMNDLTTLQSTLNKLDNQIYMSGR